MADEENTRKTWRERVVQSEGLHFVRCFWLVVVVDEYYHIRTGCLNIAGMMRDRLERCWRIFY